MILIGKSFPSQRGTDVSGEAAALPAALGFERAEVKEIDRIPVIRQDRGGGPGNERNLQPSEGARPVKSR